MKFIVVYQEILSKMGPTHPSPSKGEGEGGGDVILFNAFVLVTDFNLILNDIIIDI